MPQEEKTFLETFVPHKFQKLVLDAPERFVAAIAGKQSGKTYVGPVWLCQEIFKNYNAGLRGDYLIVAPTIKILNQAALPKFLEVMPKDWGNYKKQEAVIELVWGDKIYIRSADDPKHIESMTLRAAWGDEAGNFKWEVWQNLQARVAIYQGRVLFTTTPYTANWLKRDVLKPAGRLNLEPQPSGSKAIAVINWTSADNPYFSKEEYERLRATLPPAVFERDYCGKFTQLSGLVYPDFDDDTHIVEPFDVPAEWKRFGGMDFGATDPTAILAIAEDSTVKPSVFYVYKEFYRQNSNAGMWANFIHGEGLSRVEADPQSKGLILTLQQNFGCGMVLQANNDIDNGILRVTELIRTGRLKVFGTCRNTIDEIQNYHYPAPDEDRPVKDKPVDKFNHAMDALRYAFAKNYGGNSVYTSAESRIASKKQYVRGYVKNLDVDEYTGYISGVRPRPLHRYGGPLDDN